MIFILALKKKRLSFNQRRLDFNSINAYVNNVSSDIITFNQVKKVKLEQFMCFLYVRLISLLLSSTIVFTSKYIILEEDNKEISALKSFGNLI